MRPAAFILIILAVALAWYASLPVESAQPARELNTEIPLPSGTYEISGGAMGTTYSVKAVEVPRSVSREQLAQSVKTVLLEIDREMSNYRPDSELSRFNSLRDAEWFSVSPDFAEVMTEGQRISRVSGGAFDVTVDPLVKLWGFGPQRQTGAIPSETAIAEARRRVGFQLIDVRKNPPAVRKTNPDVCADLNGIAKGFSADVLARALESLGIINYFIAVGGEVHAHGHGGLGRPWHAGIERPVDQTRQIQCVIELSDKCVSTSGDYRNFFISENGRRYSHLIDPRTGHPASGEIASVSAVADRSVTADAMAKAILLQGASEGYALAEREHIPALMMIRTESGFVEKMTPGFQKLIVPANSDK